MSQRQHEGSKTTGRREFMRQSLGVAPLMLTLTGRGKDGGHSIHGTLWSSLGTRWRHKGDWWKFKSDRWRWTRRSADSYRKRKDHKSSSKRKDLRRTHDIESEKNRDWNWSKDENQWQREIGTGSGRPETDYSPSQRDYDWRQDDEWSGGLNPFGSSATDQNED